MKGESRKIDREYITKYKSIDNHEKRRLGKRKNKTLVHWRIGFRSARPLLKFQECFGKIKKFSRHTYRIFPMNNVMSAWILSPKGGGMKTVPSFFFRKCLLRMPNSDFTPPHIHIRHLFPSFIFL